MIRTCIFFFSPFFILKNITSVYHSDRNNLVNSVLHPVGRGGEGRVGFVYANQRIARIIVIGNSRTKSFHLRPPRNVTRSQTRRLQRKINTIIHCYYYIDSVLNFVVVIESITRDSLASNNNFEKTRLQNVPTKKVNINGGKPRDHKYSRAFKHGETVEIVPNRNLPLFRKC